MEKKIIIVFCLISVVLLGACSSEETITSDGNQVNAAKGLSFQFSEEAYVPGVIKNGTRSIMTPAPIDLGDGLIAEAHLESDTMVTTRVGGTTIPNGHYTIYAIDAAGVRHDGLEGTITSGVFVPSNVDGWMLNAGETYTFVCFNDAVTDTGSGLSYTYSNDPTALQPLIGVTTHTINNSGHDVVPFVMRHQNARVRFQITSYVVTPENAAVKINPTQTTSNCNVTNYDLRGAITGYTGKAEIAHNDYMSFTPNHPYAYSSVVETYKSSTPYVYYPGHFEKNMVHSLEWQTGSGLYHRYEPFQYSSRYKSISFGNANDFFEPNHSYVCNWVIKYNGTLYLHNDGTIGYLDDQGTRTPIGIVVKEKTSASDQGTACALEIIKDPVFPNPVTYGDAYAWEDETKTLPSNPDHLNTTVYNGIHDGQSDMNGYNWTWDANSTKDHVVRGEAKEKYPAFYQAGHYTPSNVTITGANIGKWYIPAAGEVVKLIQRFGAVTTPANEPWRGYSSMAQTDMDKMIAAFHAVNNTLQMDGQFFWTSTVCDAANTGFFGPYLPASFYFYSDGRTWWPTFSKAGANFYILPFVHF